MDQKDDLKKTSAQLAIVSTIRLDSIESVKRAQRGEGRLRIDYLTPAQMDAARQPLECMLAFSNRPMGDHVGDHVGSLFSSNTAV